MDFRQLNGQDISLDSLLRLHKEIIHYRRIRIKFKTVEPIKTVGCKMIGFRLSVECLSQSLLYIGSKAINHCSIIKICDDLVCISPKLFCQRTGDPKLSCCFVCIFSLLLFCQPGFGRNQLHVAIFLINSRSYYTCQEFSVEFCHDL
ncbi:hypothetical protein D3C86_1554940 [compost metagenome]